MGGTAGIGVAFVCTQVILHFAFTNLAGNGSVPPINASPSMAVLGFAFGISVVAGIGFGTAPAWMAARLDPIEALRGANRATHRSASLSRKALVIFQAALSLVLLSASGLLTSALRHLENQKFGFEQDRRTIVNIDPQLAGYHAEQLSSLYRRLGDSFLNIPGFASIALTNYSPMSGDSWNDAVFAHGRRAPGPKDDNGSSWVRVSGGFLQAIGNKLTTGRGIDDKDTNQAPHIAVVNEAFVRKFFPTEDPMGKHFGRSEMAASRQYEIVGVAKNARYLTGNPGQPVGPLFFLPEKQLDVFPTRDFTIGDVPSHYMHDVVVVAKPGVVLTEARLRQALTAVDPNMPANFIRTLREQVSGQFRQQRLMARLTSFFGVLSLILASIGLYGFTAYNASRRTKEIGVRMALGADRTNVVTLVLRGAFALIVLGLMMGVVLSITTGRFLENQLYGTSPYNPSVISLAVVMLGFSAFIASVIPAFKASRSSPLEALRAE